MNGPKPDYIEPADPRRRIFPASWRDAAIRTAFDERAGGVACAGCGRVAGGRRQLRALHCDHIVAFSSGGLTTWENLQLLCRACNLSKSSSTW